MRPTVLVLCASLLATLSAQDRPLPDYAVFAAQVKAHLATDEERQSGYMFIERQTEQKLDGAGRLKDESVKVFEVYPGLPGEDRYRRLIEEHGKPVPPDTLAKHDRQRQRDVESYASKISTSGARQKETQQREKERQRYRAAIDDLFRIYDIRLVRRESLEGHETIVATLMPNARVKAQTDDGNMMRHFKARAWVSESDYELVRVEIEAIDDLSIGWGLFARVHKGTVAAYQRRKVNNEAWLPAQVTFTASARVLLLKSLRLRGVSEYSGYRKFTVDTSSTYLSPEP
jgi:DNA-binding TFAR19-related protein (PDSD5 family)